MAEKLIKNRFFAWLSTLSLVTLVFTIPSNLFFKFDQLNWAIRGLRIDYLLPKIYLSDLMALVTLVIFLFWQERTSHNSVKRPPFNWTKIKILTVLVSIVFFLRQFFSPFPAAALASSLRLGIIMLLWFLVQKYWSQLNQRLIWWSLMVTHFFQSALAIGQFFTQKSLGQYYWLLGETNLSNAFGIAYGSFGAWGEKILPYGTTAHPNILAGWLVGSWLLLLYWSKHSMFAQTWPIKIGLIITGWLSLDIIFLTQSWSAAVMFLVGLGWLTLKSQKRIIKIISLWQSVGLIFGLIIFSPWWLKIANSQLNFSALTHDTLGWERRVWLIEAATKIWTKYPITGVGVNQFTAYLESVHSSPELVRFVQPVHHVGWLWLSEAGLLGLSLLGQLIYLVCKKKSQTSGVNLNLADSRYPNYDLGSLLVN